MPVGGLWAACGLLQGSISTSSNMQNAVWLPHRMLSHHTVSSPVASLGLYLCGLAGTKVIPGFGIHPWWSHLHASSQGATWQQLLEAPSQEQVQQAINILSNTDPVTNSGVQG